ncbi:YbdD/YjiX family protein [Promicromonospora sp. NPDC050249]|uniref:YbdD/YjiX family protein n=1 Tax=Promicromonospora sp. NPDC050249 TaxID=3154743 RepID=UPI0033F786E3
MSSPSVAGPPADGGGVLAVVRRGWRALAWYVTGVLGESDYPRYVAHLRRVHPEAAVPTAREYWRDRYAAQDANPGARCC